jgi:diguanylate cyclase (GGDEF)-like protein
LAGVLYHLAGTPVPPSIADAGHLSFLVIALAALLAMPNVPHADADGLDAALARSGLVVVMDSLLIAGALFLIAWETSLGATMGYRTSTGPAFVIAIFHPAAHLVLVLTGLFTVALRRPVSAVTLILLGVAFLILSISDGSYGSLADVGMERIPPVPDAGFVAGPALLALAALTSVPTGPRAGRPARKSRTAGPMRGPRGVSSDRERCRGPRGSRAKRAIGWVRGSALAKRWPGCRPWRPEASRGLRPGSVWVQLLLPYLPLVVVGGIVMAKWVSGARTDGVDRWTGFILVGLVMVRQLMAIRTSHLLLLDVWAAGRDLRHRAFHDPLTGLANRQLFTERLTEAITKHRHDRTGLAVLFCDLDDFKIVNDSLGHAAGDQLLCVVAQRLRHCVRTTDLVARLGGDEFAVVFGGGSDPESVGERVLSSFRQPAVIGGHARPVRASVGLVVAGSDGTDSPESLLRRADIAMYTAKQSGKGRLVVYRPGLSGPEADVHLADALAVALRHEPASSSGLDVHYQPIVRLTDGVVVALEALARWTEPGRGPVPPSRFVAVAEEGGMVGALDDMVLTRACTDVAIGYPPSSGLRLHVNLSASRLGDAALADRVAEALAVSRLDPHRLVVEITETSRIADIDRAAEALERIRSLGVAVALDDVGAGYSTLASLHHLPVDVVKLDRTLIANPGDSGRVAALRRSMINVAHALGAVVVAEGIETHGQVADLTLLGCEFGQGFLFARPAPLADLNIDLEFGGAAPGAAPSPGLPIVQRGEPYSRHVVSPVASASGSSAPEPALRTWPATTHREWPGPPHRAPR